MWNIVSEFRGACQKKRVAKKVKNYEVSLKYVFPEKLNDKDLLNYLLNSLNLYHEALSTHYLTQPQFFEKFEKNQKLYNQYKESLKNLARARLDYTRAAWTKAMQLCKLFFIEYARRRALTIKEAESMTLEELRANIINKKILKQRVNKYVLISKRHNIKIFIGSKVNKYIRTYEQYKKIKHVKGIVGNKGLVQGKAFVINNENLDIKNLPKGMKRGMVLIVQNAWPEFEKYYELASAIITNEGGITSHGVVVARELKIPCIVAAKIATHIFKNGDIVEVNANKGIVKIIKRVKLKK